MSFFFIKCELYPFNFILKKKKSCFHWSCASNTGQQHLDNISCRKNRFRGFLDTKDKITGLRKLTFLTSI